MTGEYTITVDSSRVYYEITVNRKYTFIRGESGTGKTRFINCLEEVTNFYSIKCSPDIESVVAISSLVTFDLVTKNMTKGKHIFVIDEKICEYFAENERNHEFKRRTEHMNGYFILITRHSYASIPYSVEAILELKGTVVNKKFINHSEKIYTWNEDTDIVLPDVVLVEDKKAGLDFYKNTLTCEVISADGNGNICKKIESLVNSGYKNIFVIGDGSALGANIKGIVSKKIYFERVGRRVKLFFPESFEYLSLLSMLGRSNKYLSRTYDYADSSKYLSWERFYTKLLNKVLSGYGGYRKGSIPKYFKGKKFIRGFYKNIEDLDKSCIR